MCVTSLLRRTEMAVMLITLLGFLIFVANPSYGYVEHSNCVEPTEPPFKTLQAHGCQDKADVILSCRRGYKLHILSVFFGHGHGFNCTCDSSIWQNCLAHRGRSGILVKYLCEGKQTCTIPPTEDVLGSTTCFRLKSDLFVDYLCGKDDGQ
ncbi:uncharacterized protein LOC116620157 [Nematostella vectensis]|uniref:uncharacterized protein LOC116620157 n=1 Tax=Nematostella vectensis TaxID=45351 RepID=UPI0020772E44|nr:uncharacterized protein LOC116620157 [Nematostella vectensis]